MSADGHTYAWYQEILVIATTPALSLILVIVIIIIIVIVTFTFIFTYGLSISLLISILILVSLFVGVVSNWLVLWPALHSWHLNPTNYGFLNNILDNLPANLYLLLEHPSRINISTYFCQHINKQLNKFILPFPFFSFLFIFLLLSH